MENETSNIFSLIWAKMPLSSYELDKVPEGHRVRPYLVFKVENIEYGFPCTSKVFDKHSRYANDEVYINFDHYNKTLIKLSDVYRLPKENKYELFKYISKEYENEIIKKIKANVKYSNYPEKVVNYFENLDTHLSIGDIVIKDDKLYNVVGLFKEKLVLVPIYKYPVNDTVECTFDGLNYYADINNIFFFNSDGFNYFTQYYGLTSRTIGNDIDDLHKLASYYMEFPRIECTNDYSKPYMLESGMIINYKANNISYKMIIIRNNGTELEVLTGREDDYYKNYRLINVPVNLKFDYEISGVLDDERFNKFYSKYVKCNSLSDLELGTIFKCVEDNEILYLRVIEKNDNGIHVVEEQPGFYSLKDDNQFFHLYDEYMIPYDADINFEIIGKLRCNQINTIIKDLPLSRKYKLGK